MIGGKQLEKFDPVPTQRYSQGVADPRHGLCKSAASKRPAISTNSLSRPLAILSSSRSRRTTIVRLCAVKKAIIAQIRGMEPVRVLIFWGAAAAQASLVTPEMPPTQSRQDYGVLLNTCLAPKLSECPRFNPTSLSLATRKCSSTRVLASLADRIGSPSESTSRFSNQQGHHASDTRYKVALDIYQLELSGPVASV